LLQFIDKRGIYMNNYLYAFCFMALVECFFIALMAGSLDEK